MYKSIIKDIKGEIVNNAVAKEIVIQVVSNALEEVQKISDETELVGRNSVCDSMKLVEICLALEEKAEEYGFEFDWTSENAMSKSYSMFRSVTTLAEEFAKQSESKI